MRIAFKCLIATAMLATAAPAFAQEVIVTAPRRGYNPNDSGYSNSVVTARQVISLKRIADYAVQMVRVIGDERNAEKRRADLKATIRNAIQAGEKAGIELATGDYVLQPLTTLNYGSLPFNGDGRPDTDQTFFLVKVKLTPSMDINAARAQIAKFIASVPKEGRSGITAFGDVTLSVVNPDQYRGQIIDLIAADAAASAAKFGPGYGVDVTGLDRPVEWARAGPVEVFLYLPSTYTVTKNGH